MSRIPLLAVCIMLVSVLGCAAASPIPDQAREQEWVLEDINGLGVVDSSHTTLTITENGKLVGNSGCNRYVGNFSAQGSRIAVGHTMGTRMACAPALMDQEQQYLKALEQAATMRVKNGLLYVYDQDGRKILRFHGE